MDKFIINVNSAKFNPEFISCFVEGEMFLTTKEEEAMQFETEEEAGEMIKRLKNENYEQSDYSIFKIED